MIEFIIKCKKFMIAKLIKNLLLIILILKQEKAKIKGLKLFQKELWIYYKIKFRQYKVRDLMLKTMKNIKCNLRLMKIY